MRRLDCLGRFGFSLQTEHGFSPLLDHFFAYDALFDIIS
jgi:hypothetical protein